MLRFTSKLVDLWAYVLRNLSQLQDNINIQIKQHSTIIF